jgi:ATP-dependent protease ClpP protease subunit
MQKRNATLTGTALRPGEPRPAIPPCLPSWFSVQRHDCVTLVSIRGEIGTFNNTAGELLAAIGDAAEVEFTINSNGGDSDTAFKVHEALVGKVSQATICGNCSSAAWILALTARRVLMASDAHALIHASVEVIVGTPDELEMAARRLRKLNARVRDLFAARTKLADDALNSLFDGSDHDLTPGECLQLGLVDELFSPRTHGIHPSSAPAAGITQTTAPTEDENVFNSFLSAFGTLYVRDRREFGQGLAQWFETKVRDEA